MPRKLRTVTRRVPSPILLARLRRNGIVHPFWTWRQARIARLGLPLACAMLLQETGGGHMIFGHDEDGFGRCPGWGWGPVTRRSYRSFKILRLATGRSNGVGGTQLTSPGLQDEADRIGGCWRIRCNFAVGFKYIGDGVRRHGLHAGVASYNGSGPAADRYAREVIAVAERLRAAGCGSVVGVF